MGKRSNIYLCVVALVAISLLPGLASANGNVFNLEKVEELDYATWLVTKNNNTEWIVPENSTFKLAVLDLDMKYNYTLAANNITYTAQSAFAAIYINDSLIDAFALSEAGEPLIYSFTPTEDTFYAVLKESIENASTENSVIIGDKEVSINIIARGAIENITLAANITKYSGILNSASVLVQSASGNATTSYTLVGSSVPQSPTEALPDLTIYAIIGVGAIFLLAVGFWIGYLTSKPEKPQAPKPTEAKPK